mgnify:CR=1 FL=1
MIDVNVEELNTLVETYEEIIKKIEENNNEIIQNFNDLTNHWKDERMIQLSSNFNLEKQRITHLENNVKEEQEIYKTLANEYKKLGNKIKCNTEGQNLINTKLDSIINLINSILYQYNSLGDISFYPRAYIIYNQRKEVQNILKSFKSIKEKINQKFNTIKEIEKTISERLNNLTVEKLIINNYESEA